MPGPYLESCTSCKVLKPSESVDNNYFAAERRCREVARGISALGVRWWGEGRIDTMLGWSHQTWSAMARSGFQQK